MPTKPSKDIQTFANPEFGRDFTVRLVSPEFTCLCPLTAQPDFGEITIEYVPDKLCIELKAFKLYLWTFRDRGAFHEAVTNEILNAIVKAAQPNFIRVHADFNVRGGIHTSVITEHRNPDWQAPKLIQLP